MADYEARIAPFINQEFWITSEFGEPRAGREPHKGLDIATPSVLGRSSSLFDGRWLYLSKNF